MFDSAYALGDSKQAWPHELSTGGGLVRCQQLYDRGFQVVHPACRPESDLSTCFEDMAKKISNISHISGRDTPRIYTACNLSVQSPTLYTCLQACHAKQEACMQWQTECRFFRRDEFCQVEFHIMGVRTPPNFRGGPAESCIYGREILTRTTRRCLRLYMSPRHWWTPACLHHLSYLCRDTTRAMADLRMAEHQSNACTSLQCLFLQPAGSTTAAACASAAGSARHLRSRPSLRSPSRGHPYEHHFRTSL